MVQSAWLRGFYDRKIKKRAGWRVCFCEGLLLKAEYTLPLTVQSDVQDVLCAMKSSRLLAKSGVISELQDRLVVPVC